MDIPLATMLADDFAHFKADSCHGFFDWWCKDSSLENKSKSLCSKVRVIAKHTLKFDPTKVYVFFKNNCPCCGPLYDDFRICDLESGRVLFTIVPKSGHTGRAEVWGEDNSFKVPLVDGTWSDVKRFFAA